MNAAPDGSAAAGASGSSGADGTQSNSIAATSVDENDITVVTDAADQTDSEEDPDAVYVQTVDVDGADYRIKVSYPAKSGIPEHAEFRATALTEDRFDYDLYREKAFDAVEQYAETKQEDIGQAEAMPGLFDLTIFDEDGKELQPAAPISVEIIYDQESEKNNGNSFDNHAEDYFGSSSEKTSESVSCFAVHFPNTNLESVLKAEALKPTSKAAKNLAKDIETAKVEVLEAEENQEKVSFETDGFSVYAIVYTVDFHWEVNGKMYDFSIPGGGFVSLEHVVEVLGIAGSGENGGSDDGLSVENDGAIKLNEVEVSEAAKRFVADVVDVQFSTPSLVDVSKVEADTTVGAIKEARGLEVEYSADLTEEQIVEINNSTVEAGDWALISVQPFTSEESLTVTMKNGEQFVVKVTDAQNETTPNITEYYYQANDTSYGYVVLVQNDGAEKGSSKDSGIVSCAASGNGNTTSARWAIPVAYDGYHFVKWTNNSQDYTTYASYSGTAKKWDDGAYAIRPNRTKTDHTTNMFVAVFAPDDIQITYVVQGNGSIDKSTGTSSETGATATANDGNYFVGWYINDELVYRGSTFNPMLVTEECTVTAVFAEGEAPVSEYFDSYIYTVSPTGEGNTIQLTDKNGINKGTAAETVECVTNIENGNSYNLAKPVAASGYRFVNWTNNGKVYKGAVYSGNSIQPLGTNKSNANDSNYHETNTFVANFVPNDTYLVTLQATEGGHITVGGDTTRSSVTVAELLSGTLVQASAENGYRQIGWRDENGNIVTNDSQLYSKDVPQNKDSVFTAVFEPLTDFNVYYKSNGSFGTVSTTHEVVHVGNDPIGSVATPADGGQFISWVDQAGKMVWPFETFVPFGDLIEEGAVYTAVFESDAYTRFFMVQADEASHGYVMSPDYENSINGHVVSMYIQDDGTIPASLTAVAYDGWEFDHWEVTGMVELEGVGETIPAGFDFTPYGLNDSGWNTLVACYKENKVLHTITYKSDGNGTVTGLAGTKDEDGYYVDTWWSGDTSAVKGAKAEANSGYQFKGWAEEVSPGVYQFPSLQTPFVPSGEALKDTTYVAMFMPNKNLVGYNMNVADVPVKWDGVKDLVLASGNDSEVTDYKSPMYYDLKLDADGNPQYWKTGDVFSLETHIPEADGYYFIGWYNKDRPAYSGNGVYQAATTGNTIARGSRVDDAGHSMDTIYFPYTSGTNRYTFEATFVGIKAKSKRVPYDGTEHELVSEAYLLCGNATGTERFKQQLERLKKEGKYGLGTVYYQLYDDAGNPVGSPTTDFKRIDPGTYHVRAYADGWMNDETFRVYKDITLEIYPAKVIIKKYWKGDEESDRPSELKVDKSKYNPKTQGVVDPKNSAAVNTAKRKATSISGVSEMYGPRSDAPNNEPEWVKDGNVWTKEYDNVLVRDYMYGEGDQGSGYYLYFADETVPEGYKKIGETWELSDDRLTTTITFTNEPLTKTKVNFVKINEDGETINGAKFNLEKLKNLAGDEINPPSTTAFTMGSFSIELTDGFYRLVETDPPEEYLSMEEPIYFKIQGSESEPVIITDKNGTPLGEHSSVTVTKDANTSEMKVSILNLKAPAGKDIILIKKGFNNTTNVTSALGGAKFSILEKATGNVAKDIDGNELKNLTSASSDGKFWKGKLLPGEYLIRETGTPAGYNSLSGDINLIVEATGISVSPAFVTGNPSQVCSAETDSGTDICTITIINTAGVSLPNTGGPGTTLIYLLGSILVALSGVSLILWRRAVYGVR